MCNSLKRMRSQETSAAVVARARYSASMEERATMLCFLEDQEIGEGPRNTRRPIMEQQSEGSPTQSTLEKAVRVRGPGVNEMP